MKAILVIVTLWVEFGFGLWLGYRMGRARGRLDSAEDRVDAYLRGHKRGYEQGLREGSRRENAGLTDLHSTHGTGVVRERAAAKKAEEEA